MHFQSSISFLNPVIVLLLNAVCNFEQIILMKTAVQKLTALLLGFSFCVKKDFFYARENFVLSGIDTFPFCSLTKMMSVTNFRVSHSLLLCPSLFKEFLRILFERSFYRIGRTNESLNTKVECSRKNVHSVSVNFSDLMEYNLVIANAINAINQIFSCFNMKFKTIKCIRFKGS